MDISENKMFVSNRIYELRIEQELSARELSILLGMSPGYINKIENGKALPSLSSIFNICDYFEISLKEFFNEKCK